MTAACIRDLSPYLLHWLDYQVWSRRTPGLQVAIRQGDELAHSSAHGVSDVASGEPLRTDHLMRVASHSKTCTAVALMRLAEAGRLRLDDQVQDHCEHYRGYGVGELTLRELLGHLGGVLRDGVDSDFWNLERPFPGLDELRTVVQEHGVTFAPQQFFKYSNIGYSVLGEVLAAVAGTSASQALAELVFEPAGMTHTFPDWSADLSDRMAVPHSRPAVDYSRRPLKHVDTGAMVAATGVVSTAEDFTKLLVQLVPGSSELLSDKSRRMMRWGMTVVEREGVSCEYGLGVFSVKFGSRVLTGHSGGWTGTLSRSGVDFDSGIAVAVVGNAIDAPVEGVLSGVMQLIDAAVHSNSADTADNDEPAKPLDATNADLDRFQGRYESEWNVIDIVRIGDQLKLIHPDAGAPISTCEELRVTGPDTLRIKDRSSFWCSGEDIPWTIDSDGQASVRIVGETHRRTLVW